MPDAFKFELVSPERLLVSDKVEQVLVPGAEGDMTVLAHHAPVLTTLRPGVLDIGMPGMSGYEVAKGLRADPEFAGLVITALTGYGHAEDRRRSEEAGFNFHLTKPPDPKILATLIDAPGRDICP